MDIAFVKLDKRRDGKEYCFEVPEQFKDLIKEGVRVLCDTARGRLTGVVTIPTMSGPGAEEMARRAGAYFPLKQIVGVKVFMAVEDITLPHYLRRSIPNAAKLHKRMTEFAETGEFDTRVVVDQDGTLLDGYSAYLVCKMWDIPFISVTIKDET